MKNTANLNLKLPENTDLVKISDINSNFERIDDEYGDYVEEITEIYKTINEVGKIDLSNYYTKPEIDNMIGTISSALDELHVYAQTLIDGGVA